MVRYLYIYNPDDCAFVEFHDVTHCSSDEIELLRLELITTSPFPLEVLDSLQDRFPRPLPFGARMAECLHRALDQSN